MKPIKMHTKFGYFTACISMVEEFFSKENFYCKKYEIEASKKAFLKKKLFEETYHLSNLKKKGYNVKVFCPDARLNKELPEIVKNQKLNLKDVEKLIKNGFKLIVAINDFDIHMYQYEILYVAVESFTEEDFIVLDPRSGKKIEFDKNRFYKSIYSIKKSLKIEPIVIAIKK